jgi:hypothetical protein
MDPSEVTAVNVTLETLETMIKVLTEKLDKMGDCQQQPSFASVVTGASGEAVQNNPPVPAATAQGEGPVGQVQGGGALQGTGVGHRRQLGARPRSYSLTSRGSVKRGPETVPEPEMPSENAPEKPYQEVRRRQPRKMNYGKNTANLNIEGAEAAPFEIFIGNTHPKATEAIIEDVLIKYAETLPEKPELKVINVKCLTNLVRDPDPRTKCWRVQVPYACKSIVENDELYPVGWSHRK